MNNTIISSPGEEWADIPGFEESYQASTHGRIKSLGRKITRSTGAVQFLKPRVLKSTVDNAGRHRIYLRRDGKTHTRLVHQLVLEAFVGPCPAGMEVCHADDDSGNNHLSNLRYDTHRENLIERTRNGGSHNANKDVCPRGHALVEPNLRLHEAKKGWRQCLACTRAFSKIKNAKYRQGVDLRPQLQEISDSFYKAVMNGG